MSVHCRTEVEVKVSATTSMGDPVVIQWCNLAYICPDCDEIVMPDGME